MEGDHGPGIDVRGARAWIAAAAIGGFLISHGFALAALSRGSRDLASLGGRASAVDAARVGFDPLVPAILGWVILLLGLAAAFAARAIASGGWSGLHALVLVLLAVAGVWILCMMDPGGAFGGPSTFPRPPLWVQLVGFLALFAHPVAAIALLAVLVRRFRARGPASSPAGPLWAGGFAVIVAVLRLHAVAIGACTTWAGLGPRAQPSLPALIGARVLDAWGSLLLGWLGLAVVAVGLVDLRGRAERAGEGGP